MTRCSQVILTKLDTSIYLVFKELMDVRRHPQVPSVYYFKECSRISMYPWVPSVYYFKECSCISIEKGKQQNCSVFIKNSNRGLVFIPVRCCSCLVLLPFYVLLHLHLNLLKGHENIYQFMRKCKNISSRGSRGRGAMLPPPSPVKISHKKDGCRRQPHGFHVSRPLPYPVAGSATGLG